MTTSIEMPVTSDGALTTRVEFDLPRGYVDADGEVHRRGVMRLATARDEILPLRDPRVRDNSAYLAVVLLARVVERIGSVQPVTPGVIESMFAADLDFLQRLYQRVNRDGDATVQVRCPGCGEEFVVDTAADAPGES
ncbi:hypothetical protein [Actinotalea sp. K2]|uniref:hypothetical protein n=1 Tax=Actinotalea sp. K2 TaxID=2939438 RepID=UPI00201751CF|nr:hypothetical protein [Actinotalea sp. K2]MCL3860422.1 hypothetical protein [Actinotalea sp. K2]